MAEPGGRPTGVSAAGGPSDPVRADPRAPSLASPALRAGARGPGGRSPAVGPTPGDGRAPSTEPVARVPRPGLGTRARPEVLGVAVIVLAVLLAHLLELLGVVHASPLDVASVSGLVISAGHQHFLGMSFIDPNAGFVTQALGHLSASDWLRGVVPWWNPYEGLGAPLAGEMQSAALFLPILLLALPKGLLLFHIVLEIAAGLATRALLRRLGVGSIPAAAAGAAFALDGTFSWFAHAPVNPIALLPVMLLGVEYALDASRRHRPGGWVLLAIGFAGSIYAGFPETAYLDGLLVGVWCLARLGARDARGVRRALLGKILAGAVAGAALAAPIAVAFFDYLPHADLGSHVQSQLAHFTIPSVGLAMLDMPYVYGPTFGLWSYDHSLTLYVTEANVAGYLTASVTLLALIGLVGRRHRGLRLTLAGVIAVLVVRDFFPSPLTSLLNLLPDMHNVAIYRYDFPVIEMAAVILAGLGFDDLVSGAVRGGRAVAGGVAGVLVMGASYLVARPEIARLHTAPSEGTFLAASVAWALLVSVALATVAVLVGPRRLRALLMAGVVLVDVVAMAAMPSLSAPSGAVVDTRAVAFLSTHLDGERFISSQVIQPNYGSYFRLAQLNSHDLPTPSAYVNDVSLPLAPKGEAIGLTDESGTALRAHLGLLTGLSVAYVVVPRGPDPLLVPQHVVAVAPSAATDLMLSSPLSAPAFPAPAGALAAVDVVLGSLPAGSVPGESLTVTVCGPAGAPAGCTSGSTPLADAAPDTHVEVPLSSVMSIVQGERLTVSVARTGAGPVPSLLAQPPTAASPARFALTLRYLGAPGESAAPAYADRLLAIYPVPDPAPLASASGCTVVQRSPQRFDTDCPKPATLVYRELDLPGWRASVNGHPVRTRRLPPLVQQVAIPAGRSRVSFSYTPPHMPEALLLAGLAVLVLLGAGRARVVDNRRRLSGAAGRLDAAGPPRDRSPVSGVSGAPGAELHRATPDDPGA